MKKFFILFMTFATHNFALAANEFKEQINLADNIVQGRVMSKSSEWRGGKIFTLYRIMVRDDLIASVNNALPKTELFIAQSGGKAEHPTLKVIISQSISHQVTLSEGDEAIFFTQTRNDGYQRLVHGGDSVIRLHGVGTDLVTLPSFNMLKVSSNDKASNSKNDFAVNQVVLKNQALTLTYAKTKIKQLIKANPSKEINNGE